MKASKKVFIIGPGFIGWNVLDLLVAEGYTVAALVRRKDHAEGIKDSGAIPIVGNLNDHDLIVKNVVENDIIIHTATADHLPSVQAILTGLHHRATSNLSTVYIHTSGSSVLGSPFPTLYTDTSPNPINAIPPIAPHRPIDLAIIQASCSPSLSQHAKIAIMIPPEIYGYDAKHQRLSIRIPTLTRFALERGFVGHVRDGKARESCIHYRDLARAYLVLLHYIEGVESPDPLLSNPYFFAENGYDFTWREAAVEVGKALQGYNLIENATPKELSREDWDGLFGEDTERYMGMDCRCRAVRLRDLGWESRERPIWEDFGEQVLPRILSEKRTGRTSRYNYETVTVAHGSKT